MSYDPEADSSGHAPETVIREIVAALDADDTRPFERVCTDAMSPFFELLEFRGAENIPLTGPLIVVKNHPGDFDTLMLPLLFRRRPDIKMVVKASEAAEHLPDDRVIRLRKDEAGHAHPDDIAALQAHLRAGGSIVTTPWGTLNAKVAARGATAERAARNALRYASFAEGSATVLLVSIYLKQAEPFRLGCVEVGEPIAPNADGSLKVAEITAAVTDLFERSTGLNAEVWDWVPGRIARIAIDRETKTITFSGPEPD